MSIDPRSLLAPRDVASCAPSSMARWTQRSLVALAVTAGAYACGSGSSDKGGTGGAETGGAGTGGAAGGATGGVKATGGATGGNKATGGATGGAKMGTGGETVKSACETTDYSGFDFPNISFQFDPWNNGNGGKLCVDATSSSFKITSYTLTPKEQNAPSSYPSFYWGIRSENQASLGVTGPKAYSGITSLPTSAQIVPPNGGQWDASYDIWLNNYASKAGSTEIMVWLNWSGVQPIGGSVANGVTIDGVSYGNIFRGSAGSAGATWNVISLQMNNVNTASFDIKKVIDYCVMKGWTTATQLYSIEMGFEIWTGGTGAQVNNFSLMVK